MGSTVVRESAETRAGQIRKILESKTFHNTEVLKRLLDYLGRQAVENHADDLKEYTIGVEACGKPSDYDPRTDSSVRVQIGKLRHKLDEYYRTEGVTDDLVLDLPKGHFKLEFRHRFEPATPPPAARPPRRLLGLPRWLWIACAVAAALAITVPLLRRQASVASAWTPAMEELWRPFLSTPRPIMIAIGAPMFVKVGNDFFRDPTLNAWDAAAQSAKIAEVQRAVGASNSSPAFTYTGIGEAEAAFEIGRLLLPRGRDVALRASNQLAWEDIGRYNMIFLGPPKYNQQTLDLPVQQDFEVRHSRVQNLRPAPGEPRTYDDTWNPDRVRLDQGHAVVSRLPGLNGAGEVFILAGSSTECTRAAVEYVTRPAYVADLIRRIHANGTPHWFQVVIRARFKSQTPIAIEAVAFHALK
jgi:hypothetical protein